jgi:hypothetical protein
MLDLVTVLFAPFMSSFRRPVRRSSLMGLRLRLCVWLGLRARLSLRLRVGRGLV